MQLSELQATTEWDRLTAQERAFIVVYCEARSRGTVGLTARQEAILAAYDTKNIRGARRLTYDYFSRLNILQVLNLYFGPSDREIQKLIARARSNKRITRAEFQEMTAQVA